MIDVCDKSLGLLLEKYTRKKLGAVSGGKDAPIETKAYHGFWKFLPSFDSTVALNKKTPPIPSKTG
jgi:hypothetical protein